MLKQIFNIEGMSCNHCVKAVTDELMELEGISDVKVSLENKNAEVLFDESKIDSASIKETIIEIGYEVV